MAMDIIVLGRNGGGSRHFALGRWYHWVLLTLASMLASGSLMYAGYRLGQHYGVNDLVSHWQSTITQSQREVRVTRATADARIDALTLRLGELQADMMRIDALGGKLVQMANLDPREFDFGHAPGQGGPDPKYKEGHFSEPDIQQQLEQLSRLLSERQSQLEVLGQVLARRHLRAETTPTGWPIVKGWISSFYGMRTDPFTGRPEFHPGIDFAGREGESVHAVAGGIVIHSGPDGGYGNMVEIASGDGYSTIYGHNERVDVKIGQVVRQGQVIAQLGSTGRSTGPHVHLEVRYQGHPINPLKFIRKRRS